MRFSISDYSISAKAKGWGNGWPEDRSRDMVRIKADTTGTKVNVHKRIAALADILLDETEKRGYRLNPKTCGGYVNRPIKNTKKPSNHSWGLALDLNWDKNPESRDGKNHTNLPAWVAQLWGRYGFAWGGNYHGHHKDPMHFEFMGSPDDADDMLSKARRDLGHQKIDIPEKYTVKAGDTLALIAKRLNIPGGWQALYQLNKGVIGPDPDVIRRDMVLRLP
ncbi:M15 family metallopeptidase [Actinoplanes sp. NPDC026619]|uniref:M15 family metallopeptidase n=1 Tax=Actinoplanes sp. NPDC026619 TaxID=3155798 RepID=UPI0033E88D97